MPAEEKLTSALARLRPRATWSDLSDGYEVWRTGDHGWNGFDPIEDLALPPLLEWTDEVKRLALAVYRARFEEFLESDQYYVLVWPPRGDLEDPGLQYLLEAEPCAEHEFDHVADCEECARCRQQDERVVDRPARWSWTLTVETWQRVEQPDGQFQLKQVLTDDPWEDEPDTWELGWTDMDPAEVELGPHRNSPDGILLRRRSFEP